MHITSPQNQFVKHARQIKSGNIDNKFILEGEKWIKEANALNIKVQYFIMSVDFAKNGGTCPKSAPAYIVDNSVYQSLTSTKTPIGILCVCEKTTYTLKDITLPPTPFVLMLDSISDPGNMGTIIRSAVAFGCELIICSVNCVSIYNDKVLRSTAGAIFKIPIVENVNLANDAVTFLNNHNIQIIGATPHTDHTFYDINASKPVCIVMGNEAHGIQKTLTKACELLVKIPIVDIESLNVSVACGIILQEVCRQRTNI